MNIILVSGATARVRSLTLDWRHWTLGGLALAVGTESGYQPQYGKIVGSTGRSTGPHLHLEVRLNGGPQNPARFLHTPG